AYENSLIYKERTKKLHDAKIKNRIFNVGDQVLLFNSRLKIFSGKLKSHWSGPFTISEIYQYRTAKLVHPDGCNFKVNCHRLKHYHGGDPPPLEIPDVHTFPKDNLIQGSSRATTRHIQEEGIDYDEVFPPVARIEAIRLFLAYASFKDFVVYQMDVKSVFLYGKIEEDVYVCQPTRFEDPNFPDRVYKVEKALYGLHQAPRAWKELCNVFEKLMYENFQISSMGELTFFLGLQVKQKNDGIFITQDKYVAKILKKFGFTEVKNASTPMETQKPLLKDEDGEEVDMCLGVEVRMRAEHTLEQKNRLEDKCSEQSARLLEKDTEITHLRSLLSLKEYEAAEAICLREQVSDVEVADAVKGSQFSCDELNSKVVSLEYERGGIVNQATALCNQVMELDAQLLEIAAHLKEEFYPRFLAIGCAINKGIQDGLKAGVDHRKAGRDLSVIKAYNPSADSKYIDTVNAFGVVEFSLLTELESKKDASMVDLMDSFRLEGPLAEIPRADDLLTGEANTFAARATADPITTRSMTFAPSSVVPPLSVPNYQVLDMEPHDGDPSYIA
nr:ribonuclease H-like domain-containing protein [Tanacetum cinerariifolium]